MPLSHSPVPKLETTVASAVAAPQIRTADHSILPPISFQSTISMPGRDITKMPAQVVMYMSMPVCLGMNHSTIITQKTTANFSSSPRMGPMLLRSSFRESRPLTTSISGLNTTQRKSQARMVLTMATGTPTTDHWAKEISTPQMDFSRDMVTAFMPLPAGVPMPPMAAPTGMPSISALPYFDLPGSQLFFSSRGWQIPKKISAVGMSARNMEMTQVPSITLSKTALDRFPNMGRT